MASSELLWQSSEEPQAQAHRPSDAALRQGGLPHNTKRLKTLAARLVPPQDT